MLKSKVDVYKENGAIVKINDGNPWAVLVVTKIMKRLHSLERSKEIVFVDSTSSCESASTSITVILAATNVGALPLAVLFHPSQTAENYEIAFNLLKENFPLCFGGKAHPEIFMTDDASAEKTALRTVWEESQQLLCHFHVAQAEWRWLFSHNEEVHKDERPRLMKLFQAVMYAKTRNDLEEAVSKILEEENKHPKFVKRFNEFFMRKEEWVLLYRKNLTTRQNNTNNFAEATIRILKDVILSRTKAFNVVALTDFCLTMWEPYLVKKLLEYAHSRRGEVKVLYQNFLKKTENFVAEQVEEVASNIYQVTSSEKSYTVNVEICSCSCPSGISGAFCKHQFFLMKEKNLKFYNAPPVSQSDRYELAVLALGKKCPPASFFEDFSNKDGTTSVVSNNAMVEILDDSGDQEVDVEIEVKSAKSAQDPKISLDELNDQIKTELLRVTSLIDHNMNSCSAEKLLRTLKEIKTSSDFDKLYFFKSKSFGKIKVQPASVTRRRPGLTKSKVRVPSGRPIFGTQNRGMKRKRNLNNNINENKANAKSHGSNH